MRSRLFFLATLLTLLTLSSCKFQQPMVGDFEKFDVKKANKQGVDFSTKLYIENRNKYGFKVKLGKTTIHLNGDHFGDVKLNNKIKIEKSKGKEYDFDLSLLIRKDFPFTKLGINSMLLGQLIDVNVKGYLKGCKFLFCKRVPFAHSDKVNPKKLMKDLNLNF